MDYRGEYSIGEIQKEIQKLEHRLRKGYKKIVAARRVIAEVDDGRLVLMRRLVALRKLEKELKEEEKE